MGNFSKICGAKQKENHSEERLSLRGATRNRTRDTRPRIFNDQSFALPIHIKVFITQKRESFRRTTLFTWYHQESNRGHKAKFFSDQSFALPTELWHHQIKNNTEKRVIPKNNSLYVVPPGIEPGTQGFSVLCSTN